MDGFGLIRTTTSANPLAGSSCAPEPMRMSFKDCELEDKRSALQRLCEASLMEEEKIMQLGDEDLLMLMVDHNMSISAKNEVLNLVAAARTRGGPDPGGAFAVGARVQGLYPPNDRWYDAVIVDVHDDGERYTVDWADGNQAHRELPAGSVRPRAVGEDGAREDILARRMEEHREAQEWLKRPKDTQLRCTAFAFMALLMCTIYQHGVQHFTEETAVTDLHLLRWAQEHGDVRTLHLHGPTDFAHTTISKQWTNLPPHHGVHLDFRLWAVGQCGACEGKPPEAVVHIDSSEYRDNGSGKTLQRRSNYYVGAGGSDDEDREKENSAFSWEFSVHADRLPAPGPQSHSAAFAEVSLSQRHTADSVTLSVSQDWHDGQDYVYMVHAIGTQQLLLDSVQLSVSTCAPAPKQPALTAPVRRSMADQAADRALASAALAATTANITFWPGQGVGSADEFMGQADSPMECATLVASRRPSANGVTYSAPDTHIRGCWAEYGMVDREIGSGSLKFVSAFLGGLNDGEIIPPKWVASASQQAHVCIPTVSECDRRVQPAQSNFTDECKTCSELGWHPMPTGSEFVCAESDEGFECHDEITFAEAETVCLALGARLCTAAELIHLEGSGTGCGHDARRVWSSSTSEESLGVTCDATERIAVLGRFDGDLQNIGCVDMESTRSLPALRCCADTACSNPCDSSDEEETQTWRQLFRQTAGNFRSPTDWIRYNSDDRSGDFSILNELEDCRQSDGLLHLKLVWPEEVSTSQEWKQRTNPVVSTSRTVLGYSDINVEFPGGAPDGQTSGATNGWHGLRNGVSEGHSLLQADLGSQHGGSSIPWFAVGTSHAYKLDDAETTTSRSSIPGPLISAGLDHGPGTTTEGIMAQVVELFAVCPSVDAGEQQHLTQCCSDSVLPGFVRDESASRNCPFIQMDFGDHECEPMPWTAAHRVCAAKGARLCTLEEIAYGCTSASSCAGNGELVWTSDDCEDVGAEIECTEEACQQINVPCAALDVHAEDIIKTVVSDESTNFTTHGWYNHPPKRRDDGSLSFELCDRDGCRMCTDEKCGGERGDCTGTADEPKACLDGLVPFDVTGADHTYTCCEEHVEPFEIGTGTGTVDIDPSACSTHADCANGHYCDKTEHCWECASLNSDWCDSIEGQNSCCTPEILFHCNVDQWPDLKDLCSDSSVIMYARHSAYSLDYLYDSDDWRPEKVSTPLVLRIFGYHVWLYLWIAVSTWGLSYVILCRKAPENACTPLPVYPYVGRRIGTGEHFRVTGGFDGGRLDATASRLVLRGNPAPCSCLPGRCGGFRLQEQHRVFPAALGERGVTVEVWQRYIDRLDRIQRRYGKVCDFGSRLSFGGACCMHVPWYLTPACSMSWASNCYCCCGCCWRCCCCCECWECCCCTCSCCCPGAAGFLGIAWHIFSYMIVPFIPWSRCDPFQVAMHKWLDDFNAELQPAGVVVKAFTFAQTAADGNRHADDATALGVLTFALDEEEAMVLEMEPVLQAGHHPDQNCASCFPLLCHAGRAI